MSCSSSSSIASSSFSPSASRTLRPLSSAGLWDAETMIPAASVPSAARNASAGVGTTPDDVDRHAQARRAGGDGGHEHVARATGVLADDDGSARADEVLGRRATERERGRGLQVDVRDAADAVGAEQAWHGWSFPLERGWATVRLSGRPRRRRL